MLAFHKAKGAEATLLVTKVHMAHLLDLFPPYPTEGTRNTCKIGFRFHEPALDLGKSLDSEISCN